jgi:RHS repeat-associated protein
MGNTNPKYLVSDLHNTASVAVDSVGFAVTRRAMDPYGNKLGQIMGGLWPDNRGFIGKPVSETTGLTDIGARKYDSSTGRFISVDPILDAGDAQQMTGYCYANNNPTTLSDPTGLIAAGSYSIVGYGVSGMNAAIGQVRDLQALNSNSYQMSVTYQYGIINLHPGFIGPQNPASYLPFIIIGVTFSYWVQACPPPVAQGTKGQPAFTGLTITDRPLHLAA